MRHLWLLERCVRLRQRPCIPQMLRSARVTMTWVLFAATVSCSFQDPPVVEVTRIVPQTVVVTEIVERIVTPTLTASPIITPRLVTAFDVSEAEWHKSLCDIYAGGSDIGSGDEQLHVTALSVDLEACDTPDERLRLDLLLLGVGAEAIRVKPSDFHVIDFDGILYPPLLESHDREAIWVSSGRHSALSLSFQMFGRAPRYIIYDDGLGHAPLQLDLKAAFSKIPR